MAEDNGQIGAAAIVEAPRGFLSARVDEKGRLKLPTAITQYLEAIGEKKVFITTLNASDVRIYPLSAWRQTENMLEEAGEDADIREDVAFVAYHYGADSEIDAQGRVSVPTELRRDLKLENEQVHLRCFKQRIDVIGREAYERRLAKAMENAGTNLGSLEKKGLR